MSEEINKSINLVLGDNAKFYSDYLPKVASDFRFHLDLGLKKHQETIAKLTTERDKTIRLMSQSWQHEPQGEELIYNHTKTLLEVIERQEEIIKTINGNVESLATVLSQYIEGYDAEEISHFGCVDINQAIAIECILNKCNK